MAVIEWIQFLAGGLLLLIGLLIFLIEMVGVFRFPHKAQTDGNAVFLPRLPHL